VGGGGGGEGGEGGGEVAQRLGGGMSQQRCEAMRLERLHKQHAGQRMERERARLQRAADTLLRGLGLPAYTRTTMPNEVAQGILQLRVGAYSYSTYLLQCILLDTKSVYTTGVYCNAHWRGYCMYCHTHWNS
jgi:hypothetical protein